jgi:SNF2 family DNA or RNA helicase
MPCWGVTVSLFSVGELVSLRSNPIIVFPIIEVLPAVSGECRYRVFQNGAKTTYYESQLQALASQAKERNLLSVEELHAFLTSIQLTSPSTANLYSLRAGRVKFVPYQYRPVLKLIRADRPRVLIADEVGVGKTIEAGLIIKELKARMDINSILIICPKALVAERKWFLEMKRFDEHFTPLDGQLLRHCLQETHLEGEWPEQYSKTILPFSLFDSDLLLGRSDRAKSKDLGLVNLDPPPKFDLVIVDEAHHIRNTETFLHQGVRYFCDNAGAVIFLSATPVQLGSEDLYTLLNVLRPDLVIDSASFNQMAEPNRYINAAIQHYREVKEQWTKKARSSLDEAARTEWGRTFLREAPAFQKIYDQLSEEVLTDEGRIEAIRTLEELYTFSPLINRTRRRDIGEFTTRRPETIAVEFTNLQKEFHNGLLDVIQRILAFCHGNQNVKFMMTTIRRQAASCLYGLVPLLQDLLLGKLDKLELLEASDNDSDLDLSFVEQIRSDIAILLNQAKNLDLYDPKVEAFIQTIKDKLQLPNNKALVFSTFRHTLSYLSARMQQEGFRYGVVHGGIPDEERKELRRRFGLEKDDPEALDILLSSEVGCEGLDFQFTDCLINYDLPWNPMRIEQRIGRIDRYGQKSESVAIINLITPGTVDAEIYERCLMRIGVFQHAIGGNEEILGEITKELHDIAESFELTNEERAKRLLQLADNEIRRIREEQELESKQAELFGLSLPAQGWNKDLEAADNYWLSPQALQRCVTSYLHHRLGKEQDYVLGEKPLKTLRLSQEARNKLLEDYRKLPRSTDLVAREWEKWLKGAQPTLQVTFDQETASDNSQAIHLSIGHPLMKQAASQQSGEEKAYVRLTVQTDKLPPGQYPFVIYRWTKRGVKQDEELVVVSNDAGVEDSLFELLKVAQPLEDSPLPSEEAFEELDVEHHAKWVAAQVDHTTENKLLVEYRLQSLKVSHQARRKVIEDQLARATNDRIRLMKQSELSRADADYNRRLEELKLAADSGDIHATPVVFGTLVVR